MNANGRSIVCLSLLALGFLSQAGLDACCTIDRPTLRRSLSSIPTELGGWSGRDEALDPFIFRESGATECVTRSYTNPNFPGVVLSLWINYSVEGNNMWHSPSICLPAHGSDLIESMSHVVEIPSPGGSMIPVSQLAYGPRNSEHGSQPDELVQGVGFWYYIFGEGKIERWVRGLPITSRSSHGRTTRGSGLTVEVFWKSAADPNSLAFHDFAKALLDGLDPIIPTERAVYYVP